MATLQAQGISTHYELFGDSKKPPVVLLRGLGDSGKSWGPQVEMFARDHFVVLPDQRGTGQSSRPESGYTIAQLAADVAALLTSLELGPAHVIGTSTGGAIAQVLALDHAALVRSTTLASSFARADDFMQREFALRRKLVGESDPQTVYSGYALFLFGFRFARENPAKVQAWVNHVASLPMEREVSTKRIDSRRSSAPRRRRATNARHLRRPRRVRHASSLRGTRPTNFRRRTERNTWRRTLHPHRAARRVLPAGPRVPRPPLRPRTKACTLGASFAPPPMTSDNVTA
jgi:aminoacrylate hydrolase